MKIWHQITFIVLFCIFVAAIIYTFRPVPEISIQEQVTEVIPTMQATPTPSILIPDTYQLSGGTYSGQTFNNCGPASLAMALSFQNLNVSQGVLAESLRPFNNPMGGVDDKSVFAKELVSEAKKLGLESIERPNGTAEMMQKLIAQDFSVIVRTWLSPNEDIGHYRVMTGYDKTNGIFYFNDSYHGPNITLSESDMVDMWKPFNYGYILVYRAEKEEIVRQIIGEDIVEQKAWEKALSRSEQELTQDPNNVYIAFNKAVAYYYLGNYSKSVEEYERSAGLLPLRMLWYQLEPIYAYQKIGQFDRAIGLIDQILYNGNLASSELYQIKGEIYLARGDRERARQEFERAIYYNKNFTKAKESLLTL